MQVQRIHTPVAEIACDALVVGVHADGPLTAAAAALDRAAGGIIAKLRERKEIAGKPNELTPLHAPTGVAAPLVVVVGLGPREKFDEGAAFRASAAAARFLAGKARQAVAFAIDAERDELLESAVAGSIVGSQGPDLYRAEPKRKPPERVLWVAKGPSPVENGRILGESVNLARRLVNEPPSEMYPETFAAAAVSVARDSGLEIEVWDQDRLAAERCGSLLAVAKGSEQPPRLVIMRYAGGPAGGAPLALVGKGVTFDSGGLSLKPNDSMLTMKCDMAGAATVLAAMQAIAQLRLPVNVMGLMGLVENMPSGTAMKLGDVLKARNGRTIEVQNTDAEGRLVLADVLDVAVERGAARIIDLATLTGSCMVALGTEVAGLMTNDEAWGNEVSAAARQCGELAWPLPMFAEYREMIESEVADIRNTGGTRYGGAMTAAKFLEEFVAGKPWVHLDIAGPAFAEKAKPWLDSGATGCFVRTLVEVARRNDR